MKTEREKYAKLDGDGVIDKRFPCWWELGFEGRHYVEPEGFFAGLEEFEGRRVQLGPDDEDIRFTIIYQEVNGLKLPLFVTSKPLDKLNQKFVAKDGWMEMFPQMFPLMAKDRWKVMFPLVAETLPHVRGIALSLDEELFFWYPTKNGLNTRLEFMGNKLGDYSDSIAPRNFFSRLISYHMLSEKGTYYNVSYKGDNWRVPELDFVPFYEFSGREGMVVPSKSRAKLMLPTLVMGRGAGIPLIRGFTDSEILYKIHKNSAHIARRYIEERFGLDCEVYQK